jgi:hypothetical protein
LRRDRLVKNYLSRPVLIPASVSLPQDFVVKAFPS